MNAKRPRMTIGNKAEIIAPDGIKISAYLTRPAELRMRKPKAAIVVLQEIFGVNHHIQCLVDDFAAAGYISLAPALFHRIQPGVDLGYGEGDTATGRELKAKALALPQLITDMQAAVNQAKQWASGGKVGIVGYCFGGLMAWRAACAVDGVAAAVCYYGAGITTGEDATAQPICPTLLHFGETDDSIPMSEVNSFKERQDKLRVQVQTYAAQHGFNCDQRAAYNEAAAKLAKERTQAFFNEHLI